MIAESSSSAAVVSTVKPPAVTPLERLPSPSIVFTTYGAFGEASAPVWKK